jgi:aminocarboxymuconate-semialdehyde decarboxylase
MGNRRQFLTSGAAAGVALLASALDARAQARKEIRVAGRRAKVVDVHSHCVFPEVGERLPQAHMPRPAVPRLVLGPSWLDAQDERGIDVQALSVNFYWWYALEPALAGEVVRLHDEGLAKWCAAHPDRFVALSSVALQDPEAAAAQLEHAVKELGSRGASIGGHVNGEAPSLPKYDPFWAKAEALGVPVFMHPNNGSNIARDRALDGRGDLGNVVGNPLETTVFLSRMILDGTLDRFPKLKVVAAHAGGYLPSYLGRTEVACSVRPGANCANKRLPSAYFKDQILVDSMVFSTEGLRHLVAETGASQVVYGSDMPYVWPDMLDIIAAAPFLSAEQKLAILGGNLVELLKIA